MALSVTYTTVNGMLAHEVRGGVDTVYVPDTLGSTARTITPSTGLSYSAIYWPYGEVRTASGKNFSPWGFVGLLGYFTDFASQLYVRARHYRPTLGRWQTVDPLWPFESAYQYVRGQPIGHVDPSGLMHPALIACLASGAINLIGNLLGGDSLGVALCKAVVSCLVAAILALILPIVGAIAGCLIAAAASILEGVLSRFCDDKPPCSEYSEPDKVCVVLSAIVAGILGCISAGGGDDEADDKVAAGIVGFITGILGTGCQKGVESVSPK